MSSQNQLPRVKMQSRLETLNGKQLIYSCLGFVGLTAIIFGASFSAERMLIYNTGDSFTCAHQFD